ncbi:MAG: hypothetical protein LC790_02090, partial [Actinobacteria bacterium]|nr:hypothetical protein [Actinomycetota bacterium]
TMASSIKSHPAATAHPPEGPGHHRPVASCARPRARYGARKARYVGTAKARLQVHWTAALVNLNPIGRQLTGGAA